MSKINRKVRKGDTVIVLTGKYKGKTGEILRYVPHNKLIVEGIQLIKKHVKPNPNINEEGGIKEMEAPIHISNVAIYNPSTKKADRIGYRILDDGRKVRYFKSNNEIIDI